MSGARKTPPTVPYPIPLLFHGWHIMAQGLPSFISKAISETDRLMEQTPSQDKTVVPAQFPFTVKKAILESYVVVRDPEHVLRVFHSEQMVPEGSHVQLLYKAVGPPKEAMRLVEKSSRSLKKDDDFVYAQATVPRKYLQGDRLASISEKYISNLRRNMASKMFQERTWTEIEDLWSFTQLEVTRAIAEALFGSALLQMHPRLVSDFVEYESGADELERKLPVFASTKVYQARERLLKALVDWLAISDKGSEAAEGGEPWDATRGSSFFQASDRAIARIAPGYAVRASAALALLRRAASGTAPLAFWSIVELLRDPALLRSFASLVERSYDARTGLYDVVQLTSNPLMQSMHAEVSRLRTSSHVVLHNREGDFDLDENWTIPKGSFVAIPSRQLALNTTLWCKARPQAVKVPLEKFWAERFLTHDNGAKAIEKAASAGGFGLEGVEPLMMTTYGSGPHACPGQELAKAIEVGSLAVFLNEYEIQLSDADEAEERIRQHTQKDDSGCKKPPRNVRMRLRIRTAPEPRQRR
ncbi:cytochrome P450 [Westerdykella ornata]|uniref:Cytochrome P450 n=1 Tax=Westerdykella ornata TaxID=318751 RepID=A0A6A6J5S7_WESOR|nr:cytochrome P450 [Westerdykella ornata]KAF2271483.1 cytochrome P450 [Westerdykella ornata]